MIGPGRRRLVAAVAAVIVAGSIFEIVEDPPYRREHWPFSPYQMYSRLPGRTWSTRRLLGITAETPPREFPLVDKQYLRPLQLVSLAASFDRLDKSPERETLLDAALRDCLDRYEALRRAGRHDGPPLRSLRLYVWSWRIDPPGRSALAGRRLLFEVPRTETSARP